MGRLVDAILGLSGLAAYGLVGLLAFGEAAAFIGLVLPGELAVLLGGVVVSNAGASLPVMITVASLAAIAGDSAGYEVGRRFGPRILAWPWFARRFGDKVERASEYLERRGGRAVFAGRWTSLLRALVPGLAGMARMPYRRFLAFNVLGGVAWATTFVVAGYLAGSSWRRVEQAAGKASLLLLLVMVLGLVLRWATRRVAARADGVRRLLDRIAASRPARWALTRFDRQAAWLRARMDPAAAFGLSWTVGVLFAAGSAWLMGVVVQDLLAREELGLLDRPVATWIAAHTTSQAVDVAELVSDLLSPPAGLVVVAVAAWLAIRWRADGRAGLRLAATASAVALIAAGLQTVLPALSTGARFPSLSVAWLTAAGVCLVPAAMRRGLPFAVRVIGACVGLVVAAALADLVAADAALTGVVGGLALGALAAVLVELSASRRGADATVDPV